MSDPAEADALFDIVGDAELPPVAECAAQPFVGVTTDGHVVPDLFSLADECLDTSAIVLAADQFLDTLSSLQRLDAISQIDSPEWQLWINAFLTFPEHGLLLDELDPDQRAAALGVVSASLSKAGFTDIRTAMRLNAQLGDVCRGYADTLREYMYWFTIFGVPSTTEPWGWQLMGHHIDVNCFILGTQMVLTPTFLGTEFEGHELFAEQISSAVNMMDSLTPSQREKAVLHSSMHPSKLPRHLSGNIDGRHRAGAGRDNLVLPYEGIRADSLRASQRELLIALVETFLKPLPIGPRTARHTQIKQHLDDTYLAWIGPSGATDAFYYKIHSPVLLVEYDNHSGIFFDNEEPAQFHVHTIVRTPNGNDYGKDLLRRHYDRFHRAGDMTSSS
ncbi:hypothetical protein AU184_26365 [Mycolicibacterium novocastrense]|uniref:DUF3500 domain-containing protein n=1 Tax=Mycolicibacterium novocastrense TaxID=59813 RepID=UPI0007477C20|nr:DUF3500 domain-containing protein [Mycolicibacterium novocastrense]KUH67477.1 hypothetical protein AU183_00100 [Mycolicibacterium novocastrense]KUH68197.1 hypothetical protein AU184_26365 [Mycolicibacterium novocastrense]KUH74391.1 hypothetical protein AU072_17380 [Mycolicibacterium novocastrense]